MEFMGRLTRSQVLAQMAGADVFALASGYEGLPHVVLEALAMGCPVVAAASGGTPEVVEQGVNGLLVDYADPPGLARALDRVLGEPDLAARLRAAAPLRAAEFPWQRTVRETTRLMEEILTLTENISEKRLNCRLYRGLKPCGHERGLRRLFGLSAHRGAGPRSSSWGRWAMCCGPRPCCGG